MTEELIITKEDLVNWLDRPPSNDDLDLIGFITTRLENFYKLEQENKQLKEDKKKIRDYINKHCVNEKVSKEVGYKCYTIADTNELEKIMKMLGAD